MSSPEPGDIVQTTAGRYWRVEHVTHTVVRAREVETGVVSHHDIESVHIVERHPGGRR
ncbi:hypothetical protein [Janibacter terrae]|uniref:hypothetical protein n=1 Tax=Janibacter terrae TaxID=103817 RepID=UPI0031F92F95